MKQLLSDKSITKTAGECKPVRFSIVLTNTPSQVHISDVHKQMLCTSSQFRKDESRQQITLGMHVEKR